MERVREHGEGIDLQLAQDRRHVDAGLREIGEHAACVVETAGDGGTGPAVIAEGGQRAGRHCIHGVGADQFLDVEHIAILGILGAR